MPQAAGQHYFAVKDGEKMSVVVAAQGVFPLVRHGDKLEAVLHSPKYALVKGGEYLPVFVAVRHPEVRTISLEGREVRAFSPGGRNEFQMHCELETPYSLKQVFAVIKLQVEGESGLFLFEAGNLEPGAPKPFKVDVPIAIATDFGGLYELCLFSNGREIFHSLLPPGVMESALDRMVRERIKGVKDSPVRPFVGPTPEYPRTLLRKKVDGNATVSFMIDTRGAVNDPAIVRANLSEFGESALDAIRHWRFLPEVKDGRPVASRAEMPFEFTSPKNE